MATQKSSFFRYNIRNETVTLQIAETLKFACFQVPIKHLSNYKIKSLLVQMIKSLSPDKLKILSYDGFLSIERFVRMEKRALTFRMHSESFRATLRMFS